MSSDPTATAATAAGGADDSSYPTIDPTKFDLIISGTGLPSSLLAAAAAFAAKSVLHIDSNSFYGSLFSSLSPSSLPSNLSSPPHILLETSGTIPEPCRTFQIDLHGPRALLCADPLVDVLIKSGASNHVEFKCVDNSLIYWDGKLCQVPDSRQALFKDKSLGLADKSKLMKFLSLVRAHIGADAATGSEGVVGEVSDEELELPFVEFLNKQRLSQRIKAIVLYAIALADYDQEIEGCRKLIRTKEGMKNISMYTSSIGRFPNAVGALIYPMYGHGELPQAFCRSAAVKGALYVLRMPMTAVLTDEEDGKYKGVRLASGQEIFSRHLVLDSPFVIPSAALPNVQFQDLKPYNEPKLVARGICITSRSLLQDLSNILVIFPPRSLNSEQLTTVRTLQLSSNVAVCPPGYFLLYLSTPCDDPGQGKEYIRAAMDALESEKNGSFEASSTYDEQPGDPKLILWSAIYIQEITKASTSGAISLCPTPDERLDYKDLLESTMKLFSYMYPNQEFFPENSSPDNTEEEEEEIGSHS